MGCNNATDNAFTIEEFILAISRWPRGADLLVAGNLNVCLAKPEGTTRAEEISTAPADGDDTGSAYMQVREIYYVPIHWEDAGRVPPSGGLETGRADSAAEPGRELGVPLSIVCNVIDGHAVGGDPCSILSKQTHNKKKL